MGSVKILGKYDPDAMKPKMMSSEMQKRVEARRLAEQGRINVLPESEAVVNPTPPVDDDDQ